jgi:nuclease S1
MLTRTSTHKILSAVLLCLLVSSPFDAWGWSAEAHRAIALIAMSRLQGTPTATRVQALLGKLTLDQIATCPDEVRELQAKEIKQLDQYCAQVFPQPMTANTEPWHFVNTLVTAGAVSTTADDVTTACAGNCAITKIASYEKVLQARSTTANRLAQLQALSFVVHFIGDIHQPLHAAERDGDFGGNKEVVSYFGTDKNNGQPIKLHAIWDNQIVSKIDATDTALVADLQPEIIQAAGEPSSQPIDWAIQSFAFAATVSYAGIAPPSTTDSATLAQPYQDAAAPVVRIQIARAGVRLAAALTSCLP